MKDVAIYGRQLTDDEIGIIYNARGRSGDKGIDLVSGSHVSNTGLIAHFRFEEKSGTVAINEVGVRTEGDEEVTNGTFDTNITGWDSLGGWAFDSSQKAIHASGVSSDYLTKSGVLVIGRLYKYEVTTSGLDTSNFIQIYSGGAHAIHQDNASQSGTFVATSADFKVRGVSPSADIFIDNVSVKEYATTDGTYVNAPAITTNIP